MDATGPRTKAGRSPGSEEEGELREDASEDGEVAGSARASGAARLLVLVEQGHAGEGSGTGLALVSLHIRVGLEVGTQVGAVSKSTVAVGAGEWLLTSVGADVALKQPGPREGLSTGRADTRQRVASDVHLQSAQAEVLLVTIFAVEDLPRLGVLGHREPGQLLGKLAQAREGDEGLGLQGRGRGGREGRRRRRGRAGRLGAFATVLIGQRGQLYGLGALPQREGGPGNRPHLGYQERVPDEGGQRSGGVEDLGRRDGGQQVGLVVGLLEGELHTRVLQLAIVGLPAGVGRLPDQEGARHVGQSDLGSRGHRVAQGR